MPETVLEKLANRLVVGANPFFDQSRPVPLQRPGDPELFSECLDRPFQLSSVVPAHLAGRVGAVFVAGSNADPSRNLCWLPYCPGRITYTPVGNKPIMTGKMSGCWLVLFRIRGRLCFGHVGTDASDSRVTEEVKNAWKIAIGREMVTPVRAFNPAHHVGTSLSVCGALGQNQQFQAVDFESDHTGGNYAVRRVVLVCGVPKPTFL